MLHRSHPNFKWKQQDFELSKSKTNWKTKSKEKSIKIKGPTFLIQKEASVWIEDRGLSESEILLSWIRKMLNKLNKNGSDIKRM